MDAIEKLAREICWAEFGNPKPKAYTKAAYWKTICEEARQELIKEARRFCWVMSTQSGIRDDAINDALDAYGDRPATGER